MQEELITFETALLIEEKRFNITEYLTIDSEKPKGLRSNYNPSEQQTWFLNITQSLLQKWLREAHGIIVEITWQMCSTGYEYAVINMNNPPEYDDEIERIPSFKTYEEALEVGLQEALKLIK